MPRILLEGDTFEFVPDRQKLNEAVASGRRLPMAIPGKFSVCDSLNGNNRKYPRKVWEKNLREGSTLQEAISKGRSIGLLEHPKDGVVTLLSPISHLVTKASFAENKQDVVGEITLLNTGEGLKMMALIEGGYTPLVSSRGYGSVEQDESGVDIVQDDYVCESWDLVFNPSFKAAELNPRAVLTANPTVTVNVPAQQETESPDDLLAKVSRWVGEGKIKGATSVKLENGKVVIESQENQGVANTNDIFNRLHGAYMQKRLRDGAIPRLENNQVLVTLPDKTQRAISSMHEADTLVLEDLKQPAQPAQLVTQTPDQPMDIKTIRESANALRNIDVSKLDPRRLAEGFTQMHALNREAAALKASDQKLSWDVDRLHEELKQLEEAWTTAAQAPASTVVKLQEQNTRTTKILRETCVLGIKYRTALSEATKSLEHKTKVTEEVARRGNGWRQRALKSESASKLQERRLNLAYASLDEFTKRYHADTTALAKHALMLEHKAKIEADAELLKRVNEATRVTQLNAIKEELKKPATTEKVETKTEAKTEVKTDVKVESKVETKVEAKPEAAKPASVTVESTIRPFTWAESVAATQRLSASSAAALNG